MKIIRTFQEQANNPIKHKARFTDSSKIVKVDKDDVWRDTVRKAKANYKEHWKRKGAAMDFEKMLENTLGSIQ